MGWMSDDNGKPDPMAWIMVGLIVGAFVLGLALRGTRGSNACDQWVSQHPGTGQECHQPADYEAPN